MKESCKPYGAALSVRAIEAMPGDIMEVGAGCQIIHTLIRGGRSDIAGAVRDAYRPMVVKPLVVVTIATHHQGFAWFYFDTQNTGGAQVLIGGHSTESWEPPMPVTPHPHSAVMAGVCGLVKLAEPLRAIIERVCRAGAGHYPEWLRPGWELDREDLAAAHLLHCDEGSYYINMSTLNPEDN